MIRRRLGALRRQVEDGNDTNIYSKANWEVADVFSLLLHIIAKLMGQFSFEVFYAVALASLI